MVSGRVARTALILTVVAFAHAFCACITERDGQAAPAASSDGRSESSSSADRTVPVTLPQRDAEADDASANRNRTDDRGVARRVGGATAQRPNHDQEIEALLRSLTLRQRIGQRFIAPVQGDRVQYGAGRALVEVAPAGFILYPWNFRSSDDVRRLTSSLQFVASHVTPRISLLLCADQEGGRVAAFRFPEFVRLPPAADLGRFADPSLIRSASHIAAFQLRDLGVNMNLAPVLDLFDGDPSTIIGDRSYGDDPAQVAALVRPYLEPMREAGVIATAKHFPGHGVSTVDPHVELPRVETTLTQLRERELVPFAEAIRAGVPAIMTAHVLYERIDPYYPATISRVFLHELLRGELGYSGVVVTDALEMAAMRDNFALRETLIRLFEYDVDLILLHREYDVVELVGMVEDLVDEGVLSTEDVDRGVRRVLRLKRAYGLIDGEDA